MTLQPNDIATPETEPGPAQWQLADLASAILAVAPTELAGISLHARPGPVRDNWCEILFERLGSAAPIVPLPSSISEDRVLGGLDLAATLACGKPVAEEGLLEKADGGLLVVRMAERLPRSIAAYIASAMDTSVVQLERNGLSKTREAKFSLLLLDESSDPLEAPPELVIERVAFQIELDGVSIRDVDAPTIDRRLIARAKADYLSVRIGDDMARAIDTTAMRFGIHSLRALHFCVKAARVIAALDGDTEVRDKHADLACRLVLGPRIKEMPEVVEDTLPPPPKDSEDSSDTSANEKVNKELEDRLIEATRSALGVRLSVPTVAQRKRGPSKGQVGGRSGALQDARERGRQTGARPGDPRRDGRLDLLATLRAAAPWQTLRSQSARPTRLQLRGEDFRVKRLKLRTPTVVIFVVDASGSLAASRMAEAKGAVELLLADCYTRRDQVALIAFRREAAELLLPPTRSLVRVRRSLAYLPAGGGTPLAAGMAEALRLALSERNRGRLPFLVFLSDGKANISLDGDPGRDGADEDARALARQIRANGFDSLFLDTSRRSQAKAVAIATEMGGRYHLLPYADSSTVSAIVSQSMRK